MYIFLMILLCFFAVIGLSRFIDALFNRTFDEDEPTVLVLQALTADSAEMRVRRAVSVCASLRCEHLRCACADDEAKRICEKLKAKYPIIEVTDHTDTI